MANDSVGVAAAASPTNFIDNESIATGGSPATVDRQRVRIGGSGYADLADVVQGDAGQNMQIVGGSRKEVVVSVAANGAVASTDCSNYRTVTVYLSAKPTGTVTFQMSNDNANWITATLLDTSNGPLASTASAGIIYAGAVVGRYFRLNVSGWTSGTITGTVQFNALPGPPQTWVPIWGVGGSFGISNGSSGGFDGTSNSLSLTSNQAITAPLIFNGSTWDRQRTPTKFFTATATASGDTALWTPTSGKKFRLMRYMIGVTGDLAAGTGTEVDVVLRDSTTATAAALSFWASATAGATPGFNSGWVDLGNGILSAAANNVLNINLSAALTSGKVRVVACGTEE
jgi:hypothetical protein